MPQIRIQDKGRSGVMTFSPANERPAPQAERDELRRLQLREALQATATQVVLAMGELDTDTDCSQRLAEALGNLREAVALSPLGSAA